MDPPNNRTSVPSSAALADVSRKSMTGSCVNAAPLGEKQIVGDWDLDLDVWHWLVMEQYGQGQ